LAEGVAVGALSLVKHSLEAWSIYAGVPARYIRPRSREMLDQAAGFLRAQPGTRGDG
jgi:galactoside O-acetyltransferase